MGELHKTTFGKTTFGKRTLVPMPPLGSTQPKNKSAFQKIVRSHRKIMVTIAATTIFGSFGALVVKAGDDAGVYDFIKSQSGSRSSAQSGSRLPPIFVPDTTYQRKALGYAPSYDYGYASRKSAPNYPRSNMLENTKNKTVDGGDYSLKYGTKTSKKLASKNYHESFKHYSTAARISQPTAYCVRMCDGYYFPVGAGSDNFDKHEAACNSVCPSAQTRVYVASSDTDDIGKASHRGQTYAKLGTAFSYRQQRNKTCSCNAASSTGGLGMFSPTYVNDTTLSHGDVVVTNIGIKAFKGGGNFPHRTNEFIAASNSKSLTLRELATLSNLTDGGRRMTDLERREDRRAKHKMRKEKALALKTAKNEAAELPKTITASDFIVASSAIRNVAPNVSGIASFR